MNRTIAAMLVAALGVQAAWSAVPSPLGRTKEISRSEPMYLMGGKEHRSKTMVRIVVLVPPDMTDGELIAVSDHYRAKLAEKKIVSILFWDDAAAYKRFINEEDEENIPVEVHDHHKATYDKDPFRIYGTPVHHLQLLRHEAGRRFPDIRRTISY